MTGSALGSFGVRARHLVPRPIRRAASHVLTLQRAAGIESELEALADGTQPIVVGPWLGEVGFELLYWVPFVRWFAAAHDVAPERLIVVTRGGASAWYRPFAARSVDVLSFMRADEFRQRNVERASLQGEQKQVSVSPFDEEILDRVRQTTEPAFGVLHPSLMNRLFAPYWWGHEPIEWVRWYTSHARLERPAPPAGLPARYAAVKFYFNDCFAPTPANRAFVERTIRRLAEEGPVVALATGTAIDNHTMADAGVEVHRLDDRLTPETNLLVQSAVVAGARRFAGTYGGFAYLAPSYGVPASTYYADPHGFARCHLELARAVLTDGGRELLHVEQVDA